MARLQIWGSAQALCIMFDPKQVGDGYTEKLTVKVLVLLSSFGFVTQRVQVLSEDGFWGQKASKYFLKRVTKRPFDLSFFGVPGLVHA